MVDRIIHLITYKVKEEKMKSKIILLLLIFLLSSPCSYAIQEGKVISDSAAKKELKESFGSVNQYTDGFFTPHVVKDPKKEAESKVIDVYAKKPEQANSGTLPPIKKMRIMMNNRKLPKQAAVEEVVETKDQAILDCDMMEYFAERTELEADGHVVMYFPTNNSTIKADKLVYNQSSNLIKAYGNVVLINDGKELFGDYMQVDMNEENALLDNPLTEMMQVRCRAKKGYMYGDKIIQEQGSIYVTKKMMIHLKSDMFGPDLDTMYVSPENRSAYMKEGHGEKFKIKTNDLIINAKKEHDTVTLRHAEIYFNNKKVGTIPSITVHTNKARDFIEADFPEFGTRQNLGMFAGPGLVFDTPKGSTMKVVPLLNYQSNGDNSGDNSLGFGAIAKFKSGTNQTDMAYGTANKVFMMWGRQKLDDNLILQYGGNTYFDDWFMGFRMPKFITELAYQDSFENKDFMGKDKNMIFSHRVAGGYFQAGDSKTGLFDNAGGIGTTRFKYMGQVAQTIYTFNKVAEDPINAKFEIVSEGSAAVYGTGDTQFVARIGPRIHTQVNNWMQDVGYFLSGFNDNTPMKTFDSYMYGRSNVYMRESYRVCSYLTLSWFGSLNLANDSWDGKLLQENGFYFSIGPDDVKLNIGYDTIRQQTFVTMALHLDAKGSTIEYKKMEIKNPERLGKDEKGGNKQQTFSPSEDGDGVEVQRAEVVDIEEAM